MPVRIDVELRPAGRRGIPAESDFGRLIAGDADVYCEGRHVIAYRESVPADAAARDACARVRARPHARRGGLRTVSRHFGYGLDKSRRTRGCTLASLASDDPGAYREICADAERLAAVYRSCNPLTYARHLGDVRGTPAERFRIGGTPFTGGSLNRNPALDYHLDSGNFPHVWSAMRVYRRDCEGGYLSCPGFGIGFALPDGACLFFDGQGVVHGVTRTRPAASGGFRISVVYYSLKQVWSCDPVAGPM